MPSAFFPNRVLIRPALSTDVEPYRQMIGQLSPGTVYFRFGRLSTPVFTDEQLLAICAPDPQKMASFMAIDLGSEPSSLLGSARIELRDDQKAAEFTVLIRDGAQRNGVGKKLIKRLVNEALERQIERLYGDVLPSNRAMIGFCCSRRFKTDHLCRLNFDQGLLLT